MRSVLLATFLLVGCRDTVPDAESIAYEGPSRLTAAPDPNQTGDRDAIGVEALYGRWGATPADCDPDNRYMTEYVELSEAGFAYRDMLARLVHEGDYLNRIMTLRYRYGDGRVETVRLEDNMLVRWPDEPRKRTQYRRCN